MSAVQTEVSSGVLTITLNRPRSLNAFTRELHAELMEALATAEHERCLALVITGTGRAFCAGQDVQELVEGDASDCLRELYNPMIERLVGMRKPVVAAINGVAAGAGLSLALACDARIASTEARFVPGFLQLGLVPDAGATWHLPRLIGYSSALEWVCTGRAMDASEAQGRGLVGECVEPGELLSRASELAGELGRVGPAVGATKALMRAGLEGTVTEALKREANEQEVAMRSDEHVGAVRRFLESRGGGASATERQS